MALPRNPSVYSRISHHPRGEAVMSGEKERVTRLETRAREAENALQQLRAYIELLRKKAGTESY